MSQPLGSDDFYDDLCDDELARILTPVQVVITPAQDASHLQTETQRHRQLCRELEFSSQDNPQSPPASSHPGPPSSISFDGADMGNPWTQAGLSLTANMREQWRRSAILQPPDAKLPSSSSSHPGSPRRHIAKPAPRRMAGGLLDQLDAQYIDIENSTSDSASTARRLKEKSRSDRPTPAKLRLPIDALERRFRSSPKSSASDDSSTPLSHLTVRHESDSDKENKAPSQPHPRASISSFKLPSKATTTSLSTPLPSEPNPLPSVICIDSDDERAKQAPSLSRSTLPSKPVKNDFDVLLTSPTRSSGATSPTKKLETKRSGTSSPVKSPTSRCSTLPRHVGFTHVEVGESSARVSKDHPLHVSNSTATSSGVFAPLPQRTATVGAAVQRATDWEHQVIALAGSTESALRPSEPPQQEVPEDWSDFDDPQTCQLGFEEELALQAAETAVARPSEGSIVLCGEPLEITMISDMSQETQEHYRTQFDRRARRPNGTESSKADKSEKEQRYRRAGKQKTWENTRAAAYEDKDEDGDDDEYAPVASTSRRKTTTSSRARGGSFRDLGRGRGGAKRGVSAYIKKRG